jgi:pimeloyl-ACP methyl ester carboxylesterase
MQSPFLLLHGALGSAAQFDELRLYLPATQQVLALNFPGHGGLPTDTEFSIAHFAESMIAFLDQNQIPKVQIFGYSMGGYVALYLTWKYPERVEQVTTLGTKFDWTPETAARETARLDPEKIAAKVPAFAQMLAERHAPADWQTVVRRTAELLHGLGNGQALELEAFQAITCPVRIGLGEEDNMVTREEAKAVAEWLPKGNFEVLPGVKHPFEQVDARQLAQWLQDR